MKIKKVNRPRFGDRDPDEMIRLSRLLKEMEQKLGRRPKKSDLSNKDLGAIRKCFGKWCYALEATGLWQPSERTLEKRRRKAENLRQKHLASRERRKQIKQGQQSNETVADKTGTAGAQNRNSRSTRPVQ